MCGMRRFLWITGWGKWAARRGWRSNDRARGWCGRHGRLGGGEMMRAGRMLAQVDLRLIASRPDRRQPRHVRDASGARGQGPRWYSPTPASSIHSQLSRRGRLPHRPPEAPSGSTPSRRRAAHISRKTRLRRRRSRSPWSHGRTGDPHAPPRPKRRRRTRGPSVSPMVRAAIASLRDLAPRGSKTTPLRKAKGGRSAGRRRLVSCAARNRPRVHSSHVHSDLPHCRPAQELFAQAAKTTRQPSSA